MINSIGWRGFRIPTITQYNVLRALAANEAGLRNDSEWRNSEFRHALGDGQRGIFEVDLEKMVEAGFISGSGDSSRVVITQLGRNVLDVMNQLAVALGQ